MKTTYKAGDDFKLLIDKVSLNEVEKEILKVQWLNELNFADLKANKCKKKFQIIKTTVFKIGRAHV